jgi:CDP-glycerol glycerophosphotransferase (TagB/SpsB family)
MIFLKRIDFKRFYYVLNFTYAFLIYKFLNQSVNRWGFGSGNGLFENNIEALLRYVLDKEQNIFFVTDKNIALDLKNIEVVKRGSFKAYLYCLQSDVLIFDNTFSDLAPGFMKFMKAIKVNVNHGQEGLKKLRSDYYTIHKINCDLTCAVSEFEKDIKVNKCGADEKTVYITGLARNDNLFYNETKTNDILFFPTWRAEIESESLIENTDYYKESISILNSEKLNTILNKYNSKLYYKPHIRMKNINFINTVDNVILCGKDENLTSIIKKTRILITDYSSVAWDYIYTNRHVIFHQFDLHKYVENPGMYIEKDDIIFSRRTFDLDMLINEIEYQLSSSNNCNYDNKYFAYRDHQNCERIYKQIKKLLI